MDLLFFISIYLLAWLTVVFSVVGFIQFLFPKWKLHMVVFGLYAIFSGYYIGNQQIEEWVLTSVLVLSAFSGILFMNAIHYFKRLSDQKVEELLK